MAKDKKDDDEEKDEQTPPPAKGGKKLVIIIAAVVVLLIVVGVVAFLTLGKKKAEDAEAGGEGGEAVEAPAGEGGEGELPGAVVALEPFIVNLQMKGSFLKAVVQLELGTPTAPKTLEAQIPKIRDAVIRILSSKKADEVLSADGKDKLRDDIKNSIHQLLGSEDVTGVYFTEFIVQ